MSDNEQMNGTENQQVPQLNPLQVFEQRLMDNIATAQQLGVPVAYIVGVLDIHRRYIVGQVCMAMEHNNQKMFLEAQAKQAGEANG